jgi:Family of unknown function (DUF6152)
MKIKFSFLLTAAFVVALFSIPALAHHSFAAQYDRQKPVTLTGSVTRLDWINPHARFFIDVKDANGKIVSWEIELGPTAGLVRRGWTRTSLKIGEPVTVAGFLAKDGSNLANANAVTLSDGKKVFAGSSVEQGQ